MAKVAANKEVWWTFDCLVTSVAMDEKFIIVGQEDGSVATFWLNGRSFFESEVSKSAITAVCCEDDDEGSNHIFYAADEDGKLYTLNHKGDVIAKGKGRPEKVHTLEKRNDLLLIALSKTGWTSFKNPTKKIKADKSGTGILNSVDGDGTLYFNDQGGQYLVTDYNCKDSSTAVATCALRFDEFDNVYAYATVDDAYLEDMACDCDSDCDCDFECELPVYDKNYKIIRKLVFADAVIQVMSCRKHKTYPEDKIYFLLRNNTIVRMTGKEIENKDITTEELTDSADVYPIDVGEEEDIKGFAVHGSNKGTKLCFQGLTEVFTISPDDWVSDSEEDNEETSPSVPGNEYPVVGAHMVGYEGAPFTQADHRIALLFQTVDQDKSGHIDAKDLGKALANGGMGSFSQEACEMMINMVDTNLTGTIDINEFGKLTMDIQQWKAMFDGSDLDRSGQLNQEEFNQALQKMGYRFSPTFFENLLAKSNPRERKLTLDKFIIVSLQVTRLTDSFRTRDTRMDGTATMHYEDFVGLALGAHK